MVGLPFAGLRKKVGEEIMPKKAVLPKKSEAVMWDLAIEDANRLLRSYPSRVARLIEGKSAAQAKRIMTTELGKALEGFGVKSTSKMRKLHSAGAI